MCCPRWTIAILAIAVALASTGSVSAGDAPDRSGMMRADGRLLAVISDLHMGLGRNASGEWNPTEDFRWTNALKGFLEYISRASGDQTDLVITGDLLELWQLPASVKCAGAGADAGCTVPELKEIVRTVISAHSGDFGALAAFSRRGENRIHIIPGNHDAALLIPGIWELTSNAMGGSESDRIAFVKSGIWASADGRIVIEHGHQIGSDVNRYKGWPKVMVQKNGKDYLIRPWGELFVQRLFNEEEQEYPIIDNLSPESAGARYRMADRGLWKSAGDVARFIRYNLIETSLAQKLASLGPEDEAPDTSRSCSQNMGYRLFTEALPPEDPFRIQAEGKSPEAQQLRDMLDAAAKDLPAEEAAQLCAKASPGKNSLGGSTEALLFSRPEVLRRHLADRLIAYPGMTMFFFGHTHQLAEPWQLRIENRPSVAVSNSGAFQRLVDEPGFIQRSSRFASLHEGLRKISLEDLAPCYTVVLVQYQNSVPKAVTKQWHMAEDGAGELLSPGAAACK